MINQSYGDLRDKDGRSTTSTATMIAGEPEFGYYLHCSCMPTVSALRDDWKEQREYVHQKMKEMEHPVRSYLSNKFTQIIGKIIKKSINVFYKQE